MEQKIEKVTEIIEYKQDENLTSMLSTVRFKLLRRFEIPR